MKIGDLKCWNLIELIKAYPLEWCIVSSFNHYSTTGIFEGVCKNLDEANYEAQKLRETSTRILSSIVKVPGIDVVNKLTTYEDVIKLHSENNNRAISSQLPNIVYCPVYR